MDPETLPQLNGMATWFASEKEQKNLIENLSLRKNFFLLEHLKTFNVKALRTLKSSWKQEIE